MHPSLLPRHLLGTVLAVLKTPEHHEPQQVEHHFLVAEVPYELMAGGLAFERTFTPLLFMLCLDHINQVLCREVPLIVRLDEDSHMVQALEVHALGLGLPNLLPFTLQRKLAYA